MKPKLVDLFTHEKELEDLILSEYPGKLFENPHHIDDTEEQKLYCFYDLPLSKLKKFLNGKNYEYELRNSKTGEVVAVCPRVDDYLVN